MSDSDDQKVAIITGAGTGMGRALAMMLGEAGWNVALAGRREEPLRETADLINKIAKDGERTMICPTDVGKTEELENLVKATTEKWGRIDCLVNNAGLASLTPIKRTDLETIENAFRVNAIAPAYLTTLCWPHLEESGEGVVLNTSTKGTTDPFPGFFAYAGSKACVNTFVMSIASEGEKKNIKGFAIAPSATETDMLRGMFSEKAIPKENTMSAEDVACVMFDCITGRRDKDNGKTIILEQSGDEVKETILG